MDALDEKFSSPQTLSHHAWWSASLAEFRMQSDEAIVERLNLRLVEAYFTPRIDQIQAWRISIACLRGALQSFPKTWRLLLEYPLLRLERRIDAIIVSGSAIFVLEFKSGNCDQAARSQVKDYTLDLRDFHAGCRFHPLVPVVVAGGTPPNPVWPLIWGRYDNPVFEASAATLKNLLADMVLKIDHHGVDILGWEDAPYRPVPTIIEAATMLYRKHGVAEIKAARADTTNLTLTTNVILDAIEDAKKHGSYVVVFVTGIPGAGKTLCGLNAAFSAAATSAFLTGTLPMVYVLQAALVADAEQAGKTKSDAARQTKSKIQSITGFLKDNRDRLEPPVEHVIVFDEAQRAWDAEYGARKFGLLDSEASIVLDIMHRHPDYAVIVALVGNGQEINTGEAGLAEWGRALQLRPQWSVRAAPGVIAAQEARQCLFTAPPASLVINPALHLSVPIRSIRSPASAGWIDAVLRGNVLEAQQYATAGIPIFITRSLPAMRAALKTRAGGNRRSGLLCSSGAKRLVADGIWPKFDHLDDNAVANWFLKTWPDVRASNALEIPATEFACQGLELDYVGLCWGGDFYWQNKWIARRFIGTKWQVSKQQNAKDYRRNTYRVLLTRARYDTIIWIPKGDSNDITRAPAHYDQTADYLLECGATMFKAVTANEVEPELTLI